MISGIWLVELDLWLCTPCKLEWDGKFGGLALNRDEEILPLLWKTTYTACSFDKCNRVRHPTVTQHCLTSQAAGQYSYT